MKQSTYKEYSHVKYTPFTEEEEYKTIKRYKEGERSLNTTIIERNMRIIVKVAKSFYECYSDIYNLDELISEGVLGAYRALDKYDLNAGVRFVHYAEFWIKCYIRNFLNNERTIAYDSFCDCETINPQNDIFIIDSEDSKRKSEQVRCINELFDCLNEDELYILKSLFGLEDEVKSTKHLSAELNCSIEKLRIIKEKALTKLKLYVLEKDFDLNELFKLL